MRNNVVWLFNGSPWTPTKKRTLENKIQRLAYGIVTIDSTLTEDAVKYIDDKFNEIEVELNKQIKQNAKKRRVHLSKLKSSFIDLKTSYLIKKAEFRKPPVLSNNQSSNNDLIKIPISSNSLKSDDSTSPTLATKFKGLFDKLNKELES